MTDKRFAIQVLPAAELREADNGVLYVHNMRDPAHGVVPAQQAVDSITLQVYDSDNTEQWSDTNKQPGTGQPSEFEIPKKIFEKMLNAGKNAVLQYFTESGGQKKISVALDIRLLK